MAGTEITIREGLVLEYYYTYRSFNRDVKLVMLEEGAVIQSVQESVVGHAHAAGKQTW